MMGTLTTGLPQPLQVQGTDGSSRNGCEFREWVDVQGTGGSSGNGWKFREWVEVQGMGGSSGNGWKFREWVEVQGMGGSSGNGWKSLDTTKRFVPAPSSLLPVVTPRRRLPRNRPIPVSFIRYPRTTLSARWRSLGITSLWNIGRIRYVHIHSYINVSINKKIQTSSYHRYFVSSSAGLFPNSQKLDFEKSKILQNSKAPFSHRLLTGLADLPVTL
ncbi:hypothetical protein TNCV_3235001 [Trichonephila clavipes]|nr:hypothetical protein TNCV_3235001 [Trichonephila clavipes]